jgi:hypothetical protein
MIVEQAVTNQVVDIGLLGQIAEPARAILEVETIDVVADQGYFDIEACEEAGMTPYGYASDNMLLKTNAWLITLRIFGKRILK